MKRAFLVAALLALSAHRLPAPISEESPAPMEAPTKPKSAPAKHKASDLSDFSSVRRFEGTWRTAGSRKNDAGTFNGTTTITIKNGAVDLTEESTGKLASGKKWSNLPAPYNSISPIYNKITNKAVEVKAEGSNLRIRWQGGKVIDWTPKTIPARVFKNLSKPNSQVICILSGQQLILTNGTGRSATYARVR